jgi:hypothetical protein
VRPVGSKVLGACCFASAQIRGDRKAIDGAATALKLILDFIL